MSIASLRQFGATLLLSLVAAAVCAQPAKKDFEPQVGQEGKDVIWVPTPEDLVDRMLRMAQTTASDVVYDLGSGDGRAVIAAAKKFGANAFGIEYNPDMVTLSQRNAQREGVSAKATFAKADLFETDFSQANVVTLFLLPDINLKLRPKILNMKPGTRIVSNTFTLGEWKDDDTATVEESQGCSYYCTAHLWIVPAKIDGRWRLQLPLPAGAQTWELDIRQKHQEIDGVVRITDAIPGGLWQTSLRGDKVRFSIVDNAVRELEATMYFDGVVREGVMEGEIVKWHVKPGDVVKEDQVVLEVMTDKATVEIPTSFSLLRPSPLISQYHLPQFLPVTARALLIDVPELNRVLFQ